jgi:MFS family permease
VWHGANTVIQSTEPQNSAPTAEPRLWTWAFVRVLFVQVTFGFSFSCFFLMPKFLKVELGSGPSEIGTVVGVGLLSAVAFVPLATFCIDRFEKRFLLMGGALLGALAALLHAWVSHVGPFLYSLRALQGLSFVLTFNAAGTMVADFAPRQRLSQALGFFGVAMLSTNALAPAIMEPIADTWGWGPGFVLASAFACLAAVLAWFVRAPAREGRVPEFSLRPLASARKLGMLHVSLTIGMGFGTMVTFTQPFALSMGEQNVSQLFIGYTLAAVFVRILLGGLADRVGRERVALGAMVAYTAVLASAAWLRPGSLFFFGAGLGLAHGFIYPALNAMLLDDTDAGRRGIVMVVYNGAFQLGFAISALGLGIVAQHFGYPTVFLLCAIFSCSALLVLTGLVRGARRPELAFSERFESESR